jgi:hypothetical protein
VGLRVSGLIASLRGISDMSDRELTSEISHRLRRENLADITEILVKAYPGAVGYRYSTSILPAMLHLEQPVDDIQ